MQNPIFSFLTEIIGAFVVWVFKGFKGKLSDEMSGPYESSNKSWRNMIISFIILFIVALLVFNIQKRQSQKRTENKYEITIKY